MYLFSEHRISYQQEDTSDNINISNPHLLSLSNSAKAPLTVIDNHLRRSNFFQTLVFYIIKPRFRRYYVFILSFM